MTYDQVGPHPNPLALQALSEGFCPECGTRLEPDYLYYLGVPDVSGYCPSCHCHWGGRLNPSPERREEFHLRRLASLAKRPWCRDRSERSASPEIPTSLIERPPVMGREVLPLESPDST